MPPTMPVLLYVQDANGVPTPLGPTGSEVVFGLVGAPDIMPTVVPTVLNANAYDAGDILFDATPIPDAVRVQGGKSLLQSLLIRDLSDTGPAMTLYFLTSGASIGSLDAAWNLSDAQAQTVVAFVDIAAADWKDVGGAKVVNPSNIGKMLRAAADQTTIWVAASTSGTPTLATNCIEIEPGLLRS